MAVSNPHELLGTTWQLGPNFYIGNGPGATGTYMAPPFVRAHPAYEAADYAMEAVRLAGRPLTLGQVSRFWLFEGIKQWAHAPVASIRLFVWKLGLLTHRFEIPDSQDIEFVQIVAAPALACGIVDFGIVFPLAVIGLARVPRTPFWWFLVLSTWLGLAATAVFFVVGRYRVPWIPGLVLLAAAGLVDLARLLRRGDWLGLSWRIGILGLPATLLSWRHQADPVPTRWGNQLIAMALADLRVGQIDPAIDALDLARASSPEMVARVRELSENGPFHDLLGDVVYRELAKAPNPKSDATETIRQARLLRQLRDRSAQARSLIETIVRSSSTDALANRELGALLLSWPERPTDRDRALKVLELASRQPGGDVRATLLLALATGNRERLDNPAVVAAEGRDFLVRLVRAMLGSGAGQGPNVSRAGPASPRLGSTASSSFPVRSRAQAPRADRRHRRRRQCCCLSRMPSSRAAAVRRGACTGPRRQICPASGMPDSSCIAVRRQSSIDRRPASKARRPRSIVRDSRQGGRDRARPSYSQDPEPRPVSSSPRPGRLPLAESTTGPKVPSDRHPGRRRGPA